MAHLNNHPLQLSTKAAAVQCGIKMISRLFENNELNTSQQISTQEVFATSSTFQDSLKTSIASVKDGNIQKQETFDGNKFKKLFDQYDRHHVRDLHLNQLFDALCSSFNLRIESLVQQPSS